VTDSPRNAAELEYRPIAGTDLAFVKGSWQQSRMRAPDMPAPNGDVKRRLVEPLVDALLNRPDVNIVGAYGEHEGRANAMIGWIAWTWGQLPMVHYAYVRGPWRKHGVFSRLLKEAMVGHRFLYGSMGELPKYGRRKALSRDKIIVAALSRRGVYATLVPAEQWLERMR
jgi:hypothetical protein